MNQSAASAASGGKSLGGHLHDIVELGLLEVSVWESAPNQIEELFLGPIFARRFGDYLLGQNVKRPLLNEQAVQLSSTHRANERRTFNQVVSS